MRKIWKKGVSLLLIGLLGAGMLSGCGGKSQSTPSTAAPAKEETAALKILTIGNSASLDDCHLLNLVAAAEGYEKELYIGTLYHSGCTLARHVENMTLDRADYSLHISSSLTPDQPPSTMKDVTLLQGIKYADWDIVVMNGSTATNYKIGTYTDGNLQKIQDYVNQNAVKPVVFAWNMYQASPESEELMTRYEIQTGKSPEENPYKRIYQSIPDRKTQYAMILDNVSRYIATDDTITYLIPTGTAVENALTSYLEEKDINRDYAHLSDLSRVIASYTWYCTLTGVDHLNQVKLYEIPMNFLKSTTDKTVSRVLTDWEKQIILESVNNALEKPLELTPSRYTTAPEA